MKKLMKYGKVLLVNSLVVMTKQEVLVKDIEDAVPLPGQHLQRFILILQTESDNSVVVNLFCEFDKAIRRECFAMLQ